MKYLFILLIALTAQSTQAQEGASNGLVVKPSEQSAAATLDKLENLVKAKGFTVFSRIDHAAGASQVGQSLRPTQLLIFGNPKIGTALLLSQQSIALDLPIHVAAWEDAQGNTWLAYSAPRWLASRHGITERGEITDRMTDALDALTGAAAKAN